MHVVILGTYPPTQCGIATFTLDVESSLRSADVEVSVVPVTSGPTEGSGDANVDAAAHGGFRIRRDDRACALTYRASRANSLTTEHEGSVSRVRA